MNSVNNSVKLLRVISRLPVTKRQVSSIRPRPETFVYNGQTYTKMLYPHTLAARAANYPWMLLYEKSRWVKMIVLSTVIVLPLAIYVNFHVYSALYAAKRAEKAAKKAAKKAGKQVGHH